MKPQSSLDNTSYGVKISGKLIFMFVMALIAYPLLFVLFASLYMHVEFWPGSISGAASFGPMRIVFAVFNSVLAVITSIALIMVYFLRSNRRLAKIALVSGVFSIFCYVLLSAVPTGHEDASYVRMHLLFALLFVLANVIFQIATIMDMWYAMHTKDGKGNKIDPNNDEIVTFWKYTWNKFTVVMYYRVATCFFAFLSAIAYLTLDAMGRTRAALFEWIAVLVFSLFHGSLYYELRKSELVIRNTFY